LEREQIPLAARILRVADTFSAMTENRPYRAAVSEAEATRYLTEWAGIEFDPKVVKAFLSLENFAEVNSSADKTEDSLPDESFENEELMFQQQF
jgi:HD-GYP domain-containing protein (c-di-GMP phosphodiesterase class II)